MVEAGRERRYGESGGTGGGQRGGGGRSAGDGAGGGAADDEHEKERRDALGDDRAPKFQGPHLRLHREEPRRPGLQLLLPHRLDLIQEGRYLHLHSRGRYRHVFTGHRAPK